MGAAHGSNTHGGDSKYGSISAIHIAKWHGHICFTCALQAHLTYVSLDQVWYYKEQAARGNSAAILNLAVCHLSGVGMLRNSAAGAGVRARVCVFARACVSPSRVGTLWNSAAGVALMRDAASRGNAMAVRRN